MNRLDTRELDTHPIALTVRLLTFGYYEAMNVDWDSLDRTTWDDFHREYGSSLQQSWPYGQALQALGVRIHRAAIRGDGPQGGTVVGLAQFMVRRIAGYVWLASCTRGPVWHTAVEPAERARAIGLLKRSLPVPRLRAALISPDAPTSPELLAETQGLWRVMTGYSTVILDLTAPLEALRAGLDGKWRNRLAKAESDAAFSARVEPSLPEARRLLERESQQRAERRFHGLPTDFVQAYIEACTSREQAFAVSYAQSRKETQAALLFLIHGNTATYHIGWSSDAGRKTNAHNLLMWRGIEYLRRIGVKRLDLGGVNTRALPGITRFKLGTGGQVLTLAGSFY